MIDSVLNLLFRCGHKRLTRPVTPVSKDGKAQGDTYVVCLDCGKQFGYDLKQMRVGKPLATSAVMGVLPPDMPGPSTKKLKIAAAASAVPLGIAIGSLLSSKRKRAREAAGTDVEPAKPGSEGSDPAQSK